MMDFDDAHSQGGETSTSSSTAPVTVMLQSLWSSHSHTQPSKPEEHELVTVEHPLDRVATVQDQDTCSTREGVVELSQSVDYGYKYEFSNTANDKQAEEEVDGNCCQAPQQQQQQEFQQDDDDSSEASSLLDPTGYEDSFWLEGGSGSRAAVASAASQNTSTQIDPSQALYLLGKTYHATQHDPLRQHDQASLFWFTYRCDFPEIVPYHITSDAGWGCMLRSAQMMLGQTLRLHFQGRDYSTHQLTIAQQRRDFFLRTLLTWMADHPSRQCPFSLHNMVATGMTNRQILPGEWYGPGSACYVLRDLAAAHEERQLLATQRQTQAQTQTTNNHNNDNNNASTKTAPRIFRVYVAPQGTVYKDAVHTLMTKEAKATYDEQHTKQHSTSLPDHPLANAESDLQTEQQHQTNLDHLPWDTGLLLLVPLRLGLGSINHDEYATSLAHTFRLPQSVGILGGRPRGARWFYGAHADGSHILGLDPHTVQDAPRRRKARIHGKIVQVVDISESYLQSIHTTQFETVPMLRMDPSIALGFYCRTAADLHYIQESMTQWQAAHPTLPELFSIMDTSPEYAIPSSHPMMEDLLASDSFLDDDNDNGGAASEEDEYVLL